MRAAVVAGDRLVVALGSRAPSGADLACFDLRDGAVCWRLPA